MEPTTHEQIELYLRELTARRERAPLTLTERLKLVRQCTERMREVAAGWVAAACRAKSIPADSSAVAEEILAGPVATVRYLQLLADTLEHGPTKALSAAHHPPAAGERARLRVFPTPLLFDTLLFRGFHADVWLQPGTTSAVEPMWQDAQHRLNDPHQQRVVLVLGAGNVSSIAATDTLTKIFQDGALILLKMNPVNAYLGPVFAELFQPLIQADLLRIIQGGADVGSHAVHHASVAEVHITGSVHSHDMIVWGPAGPERDRRRIAGDPLLKKPISSELGNVTPWLIVPGNYSESQLDFQAENLAAMITNNASFNCIAAKVIVTWRDWPQRQSFLNKVEAVLARVPKRVAYYPGAMERYQRFTGDVPPTTDHGKLPWRLMRDVHADDASLFFCEESFVSVCAETTLDADSPMAYLAQAIDFCNQELSGTLGAGLMVPADFRATAQGQHCYDQALANLRYGTICVNHWPGLGYALMATPWGGYPGATLLNPQSGSGWVHNTYMLANIEKSVLTGPLTLWPKPFWFPTHQSAAKLAWRVLDLYLQPNLWNLTRLVPAALMA